MANIINADDAVRAILKFAGTYGLKGVVMTTTRADRCRSIGTIELHPEAADAYPVILEHVRFPNLALRSAGSMMRINIRINYYHAEKA